MLLNNMYEFLVCPRNLKKSVILMNIIFGEEQNTKLLIQEKLVCICISSEITMSKAMPTFPYYFE